MDETIKHVIAAAADANGGEHNSLARRHGPAAAQRPRGDESGRDQKTSGCGTGALEKTSAVDRLQGLVCILHIDPAFVILMGDGSGNSTRLVWSLDGNSFMDPDRHPSFIPGKLNSWATTSSSE
jgi:hypothetical protein